MVQCHGLVKLRNSFGASLGHFVKGVLVVQITGQGWYGYCYCLPCLHFEGRQQEFSYFEKGQHKKICIKLKLKSAEAY